MSVDLLEFLDLPGAPEMNDDLAEMAKGWAADPDGGASVAVQAPCMSCGRATRERCLQCARAACASHRGTMTGLCARCANGDGTLVKKARPAPSNGDLGIAWID